MSEIGLTTLTNFSQITTSSEAKAAVFVKPDDTTTSLYYNIQLATVVGWVTSVVLATLWRTSQLSALNLRLAWRDLMRSRGARLDFLDIYRVGAIFWVMVNHLGSEGRVDVLERNESAKEFKNAIHSHPVFGALLGNSALGVEVFLVLSGLLAARSWHTNAQLPFAPHAFQFLIKRVLRLLPVVTVFVFLASGPLVRHVLPRFHQSMVSACGVRGLAAHLFMVGNWQQEPTCLGYLWYVSLDIQLYLMAPLLLHLLYRNKKVAMLSAITLVTLSMLKRAQTCTRYNVCNKSDVDIPFIYYPGTTPEMLAQIYNGLWEMYGRPWTKLGPFVIGICTGFLTNHCKFAMHPTATSKLTAMSFFGALSVVYAILPEYWYPDMERNMYSVTYTATFRVVFAFFVSLGMLSQYYSEDVIKTPWYFTVAAKLTFGAFLWHMPAVYLFHNVRFFQETTSVYVLIALMPVLGILSFCLALIFYLFVENPIARISVSLLKRI